MFTKAKFIVNSRTNIFVRVMACFLLTIFVPTVIMGVVWYRDIGEKNYDDMMEKERRSLVEVEEMYNGIVASVEQDLLNVLYGTGFQNYIASKKSEYMIQLMAEVFRSTNWNPSLYSVYFYNMGDGTIWDSTSKLQSLDSFYDTQWLEQRTLSVRIQHLPIRKNMDEAFYNQVLLDGTSGHYTVKNVLTVITPQVMNAILVGNMDVEALGRELLERFDSQGKQVCLFKESDLLYNSLSDVKNLADIENLDWKMLGDFYEAMGEERHYFSCALGGGELYYMESIPLDMLYSNSITYRNYILRVTGIVLAVMVILAFLLTSRLYRPLDELYSVVSSYRKKEGEARLDEEAEGHAIKKAFSHMKSTEKTESRIMDAFVSAAKLRMLFDGMITQEHFLQETSAVFSLTGGKKCSLFLCSLRKKLADGEREERNRRLKETLDVYLAARLEGILSETSNGDFAILFSRNTEEEICQVQQFLIKIINELTEDNNYFASSKPFFEDESIQEQYRICRISLENEAFFERQPHSNEPVYPLAEENYSYKSMLTYAPSMIRAIVTGESWVLEEKLLELEEEILTVGRKDYAQNLCARILGEIDRELALEPLESNSDLLRKVYGLQPLSCLMDYMKEILQKSLELMNNQESHQQENKYYRDAVAYMQENYWKNINVTEVADALGISYVYLNKIFKTHHQRDEKLIDYLNLIRIGKAAELLLETDETLTVIAEKVGYNNVQSFSRFFKKYKGLTPGEWKRKNKGML